MTAVCLKTHVTIEVYRFLAIRLLNPKSAEIRPVYFCLILVVYLVAVLVFSESDFWEKEALTLLQLESRLGTKLLGISIGEGFWALKGLSSQIEEPQKNKWCSSIVARVGETSHPDEIIPSWPT